MQKSPARADFSGWSVGRAGRRRRLEGKRGRGTLTKAKSPIFGMLRRVGAVVIRMLENVQQVVFGPLIERIIVRGSVAYTDEYDSSSRLNDWGYNHQTVCHAAGERARDEDAEGFWSWLRPHCGIAHEKLPLSLGRFEFGHNVRVRVKALLGELIGLLVASPPIST